MLTTLPHTETQPGLRGHSHNEETDLLKRYTVEKKTPSGWLALASYNEAWEAELTAAFKTELQPLRTAPWSVRSEFRVFDTKTSEAIW